jgi:hypothetical protein
LGVAGRGDAGAQRWSATRPAFLDGVAAIEQRIAARSRKPAS